ncbi:MAG: biotin--[acetyl-CoA-carboxylase] ligase, partial [Acidimicrobiales bacterium]
PEGTAVIARTQSAGKGRLGRAWHDTPGGSVLCSMLYRPRLPADRWFLLGWLVAISAAEAIAAETGVETACKWPNDLVAGEIAGTEAGESAATATELAGTDEGRKLAGVLAESVPPDGVVVGIGINCGWSLGDPPGGEAGGSGLAAAATSLDHLCGAPVDPDAITTRMLAICAARYAELVADGGRSLVSAYRARLSTIGRLVRVELVDETFKGRALDVDDSGRLLVNIGACIRIVDAGDVVHLR